VPVLRSRIAIRRARWMFMKIFLVAMALLAAIYALLVVTHLVERLRWA
jgi:hypothetical protein